MGERTNNVGGDITIKLVNMMEVSTVINYHPGAGVRREEEQVRPDGAEQQDPEQAQGHGGLRGLRVRGRRESDDDEMLV